MANPGSAALRLLGAGLWSTTLVAGGIGLLLQRPALAAALADAMQAAGPRANLAPGLTANIAANLATAHTAANLARWDALLVAAGLLLLTGGEYLLMALVADPLFPRARPAVRETVETITATLALGSLLWIAVLVAKMLV